MMLIKNTATKTAVIILYRSRDIMYSWFLAAPTQNRMKPKYSTVAIAVSLLISDTQFSLRVLRGLR